MFISTRDWNAIDTIVDNLSDIGKDAKYFRLEGGYQSLMKILKTFCNMGDEIFLAKKLSSSSKWGSNYYLCAQIKQEIKYEILLQYRSKFIYPSQISLPNLSIREYSEVSLFCIHKNSLETCLDTIDSQHS